MPSTCPARPTLHDPYLARASERRGYVTTSTGIRIGIAAARRVQPLPSDAHAIQSALLDPATASPLPLSRRLLRAVVRWL